MCLSAFECVIVSASWGFRVAWSILVAQISLGSTIGTESGVPHLRASLRYHCIGRINDPCIIDYYVNYSENFLHLVELLGHIPTAWNIGSQGNGRHVTMGWIDSRGDLFCFVCIIQVVDHNIGIVGNQVKGNLSFHTLLMWLTYVANCTTTRLSDTKMKKSLKFDTIHDMISYNHYKIEFVHKVF